MNTMLVVVILSLSNNGLVIKTTTEIEVKDQEFCKVAQLRVMNSELPKGSKLISAMCETTGSI